MSSCPTNLARYCHSKHSVSHCLAFGQGQDFGPNLSPKVLEPHSILLRRSSTSLIAESLRRPFLRQKKAQLPSRSIESSACSVGLGVITCSNSNTRTKVLPNPRDEAHEAPPTFKTKSKHEEIRASTPSQGQGCLEELIRAFEKRPGQPGP